MAVELAGGLGAIGLYAVPGYALTELFPQLRRLPVPRRAGYGYLLGVATIAGSLYLLSHASAVPLRPPAIWSAAATFLLLGLVARGRRWRRDRLWRPAPPLPQPPRAPRAAHLTQAAPQIAGGGDAPTPPVPAAVGRPAATRLHRLLRPVAGLGGAVPAVCVLAATFVWLGVFAEAISNPVHDWDGRMTWTVQALYLRDAGTVDAEVLRNGRWYVSHPQYPLLLPLAQAAALEALGAEADSHLQRALYAAFFAALLLVVYDGARHRAGRAAAALVVLAASAVPFFVYGEGGAFSTYSDLPLACFFGAALVQLLGPRPGMASGLAAGLLLAAAALTKNEGVLLAPLALVLGWRGGAPAPRPGRIAVPLRRLAAAGLPLLLALTLFASWRAGIPNREDESYPDLLKSGSLWPGIVTHVALFGPVLLRQMYRVSHWARFWWMVPAVLLAGRRALRHPSNRRLLLAAAGPLAIGWVAYSIHSRPALLASVTWERLLLQGAVPWLVLLAAALAEVDRHFRPASGRQVAASAPASTIRPGTDP
jgi:hypothetical protein